MPRDPRDAASSPATPLSASSPVMAPANVAAPRGRTGQAAPGDSVDSTGWARTSFSGQFRRTQLLALEAFERSREVGHARSYLVLPPGSGKTVLGLEIARRLQRPTLCLGPNTAIQEQWIGQWRLFQPALVSASDDSGLSTPLTALTYQAICNLDRDSATTPSMSGDVDDAERRREAHRTRLAVIKEGDREHLLGLLHPNGRRIIETLKQGSGTHGAPGGAGWTLILDECHHLLEMWGHLLEAIVAEIGGNVFVVGLTATPPAQLDRTEAALYARLFGQADFQIPTPAVVKEGHLAPYQELAYLTRPLAHESAFVDEDKQRFDELMTTVCDPRLGTVCFFEWVRRRLIAPRTATGAPVSWATIEATQPALARAGMRLFLRDKSPLPERARVREQYRQPLTADDWIVLLGDWSSGHLAHSTADADKQAWDILRQGLPSVGYHLTTTGIRTAVAPVDRVLLLSGAKSVAAIDILTAEAAVLGTRLRALLLCDYELAGSDLVARLRGVLDPQAGSAALTLKILLTNQAVQALDPLLVTGRTVACARQTASRLVPWLHARAPYLDLAQSTMVIPKEGEAAGWDDVVVLTASSGWTPRTYVPLVTAAFEDGVVRCLIGTRGLLGEGWDAPSVNVLIDLTGATTLMSVAQMRGRSLRLDPSMLRKVAHNWDIVCVDTAHPKGDADYGRFVRKHENYYAPTTAGEIESGVSHVDARLTPFGPPPDEQFAAVNAQALAQVDRRDEMYARWRIGEPYRNVDTTTLRVLVRKSPAAVDALKASKARTPGVTAAARRQRQVLLLVAPVVIALLAAGQLGWWVGILVYAVALVMTAAALAYVGLPVYLRQAEPADALRDIGRAVAQALCDTKGIAVGAAAVDIRPQPDGYYRCVVVGASYAESSRFADALDECLAPLQAPRYIVPRLVRPQRRGPRARLRGLLTSSAVVYHAVPSTFSSARKVAAFAAAWSRFVNPASAVGADTAEGAAILQVQRGEDVFAETTQIRALWD